MIIFEIHPLLKSHPGTKRLRCKQHSTKFPYCTVLHHHQKFGEEELQRKSFCKMEKKSSEKFSKYETQCMFSFITMGFRMPIFQEFLYLQTFTLSERAKNFFCRRHQTRNIFKKLETMHSHSWTVSHIVLKWNLVFNPHYSPTKLYCKVVRKIFETWCEIFR